MQPEEIMAEDAPRRPTQAELAAAVDKTVPDVIQPDLEILFVGINPGLYSAAVGHHFARPGNRFWPALSEAGITPRQLLPHEEELLLQVGCGITNLVDRATARADELDRSEFVAGSQKLLKKVEFNRPRIVAFLGISAYRAAFGARANAVGNQETRLGPAAVWLLPNPSGLNAHYQLPDFARLFRGLKQAAQAEDF